MTVERVRITPSQITLKDANNRVVFDTSNQYIRTETNGNLRLNTQIPATMFSTLDGLVRAENIQGAILAYAIQQNIFNGSRPSFRFPEFTGTLAISITNISEFAGPGMGGVFQGFHLLRVSLDGVASANVASRFLFSQPSGQGGGGLSILGGSGPILTNVAPGTLITLGPVFPGDPNTGQPTSTTPVTNAPGANVLVYTAMAYQNQTSNLPLTVTP